MHSAMMSVLNISALLLSVVLLAISDHCVSESRTLIVVSRKDWGARQPKKIQPMANPVDTVVIHHTYNPPACHSLDKCKADMRSIQNFHMDVRGWDDIGYSFVIGLDRVFEGRGWSRVGAHAPTYNNHSIGISLIGDYSEELPNQAMLFQCQQLISYGVSHGYIRSDYQLVGHRQVRDTDCPGDRLFDLITTWSHWIPHPATS